MYIMSVQDVSYNIAALTQPQPANVYVNYIDPKGYVVLSPQVDPQNQTLTGYVVTIKKLCNVTFTGNQQPITFNFDSLANGSIISKTTFVRDVTINPTNINVMDLSSCTFNIETSGKYKSNVQIIGTNALALNMNGCSFTYYGVTCLATANQNVTINRDYKNSVTIDPSVASNQINDIMEPRSFLASSEVHLVANTTYSLGTVSENYRFVLDGANIIIKDTLFSTQCNFRQQGNSLKFNGCIFNVLYDGSTNSYECQTDGNITFIAKQTIIKPSPSLFNSGNLWNFIGSSTVSPIPAVNILVIELSSGNFQNFANVNVQLQSGATYRLVGGSTSTAYTFTLGTQNTPILYPINILLDTESQLLSATLTYYTKSSVGIKNATSAELTIYSLFQEQYLNGDVSGGLVDAYLYALSDNGSVNKVISIGSGSLFYNNGGNIIDPLLNIQNTVGNGTYIYQKTTGQVNMSLENALVRSRITVNQPSSVSSLSMIVPANTDLSMNLQTNVRFTNTSLVSKLDLTYVAVSRNVVFYNSDLNTSRMNVDLLTGLLDISACHVNVANSGVISLAGSTNMTMEGCVVDMVNNPTVLAATSTSAVFSENTIKVSGLTNNLLDVTNLLNHVKFGGSSANPFNNTNIINLAQSNVKLNYTSFDSVAMKLAVDSGVKTVSVTADVSGNNIINTTSTDSFTVSSKFSVNTPVVNGIISSTPPLINNYSFTKDDTKLLLPNVRFTTDGTSTYLINVNPTKEAPTLVFTDASATIFQLEPTTNTIDPSANFYNNFVPSQVRIVLNGFGTYNMSNDTLFKLDSAGNVYLKHADSSSYTVNSNKLLTINVDDTYTDVPGNSITLTNSTCNGLAIVDNYTDAHDFRFTNNTIDISNNNPSYCTNAVVLNSGSTSPVHFSILATNTIKTLTQSAINIVNNSSTSATTINSATFNYGIVSGALINITPIVPLSATTYIALNAARKLVIINPTFNGTSVKYFINNQDSVLLNITNINADPLPIIAQQLVFWQALYYIKANDITSANFNMLVGDGSVPTAEAWDINTPVTMSSYLGNSSDNTYNQFYSRNNKYGIIATNVSYTDPSNNYANSIGPFCNVNIQYRGPLLPANGDGNIDSIILLEVICVVNNTAPSVALTLNKTYTNNTTSHTGKLGGSWTDSLSPAVTSHGWLNNVIDFAHHAGPNNLLTLKSNNNIVDMSLNITGSLTKNIKYSSIYIQTQDQIVNNGELNINNTLKNSDVTLQSYLQNNLNQVNNGVFQLNTPLNFDTFNTTYNFYDENGSNPYKAYKSKYSSYLQYNVIPIKGTKFNFVNDVTFDLSWNNTWFELNTIQGPNGNNTTTTFTSIDSSGSLYTTPVLFQYTDLTYINNQKLYITPQFNVYVSNTPNNSVFRQQNNMVNVIQQNQLWVTNLDVSWNNSNVPVDGNDYIIPSNNIFNTTASVNITTNSVLTLLQEPSPLTGERQYQSYNYIGVIIINSDNNTRPDIPCGLKLQEYYGKLLTSSPYQNPNGSRGVLTFQRYDSQGGPDGYGNLTNDEVPYFNTFYRYRVTEKINNMRDLPVQSMLVNYKLGSNANNVAYVDSNLPVNNTTDVGSLTPATITITNINIPLIIDVHKFISNAGEPTLAGQTWNNLNSYAESINRDQEKSIYMVASGIYTGTLKCKFVDNSNNIVMTDFINKYFNSSIDPEQFRDFNSYAGSSPSDTLNNISNSYVPTDISGNGQVRISGVNNVRIPYSSFIDSNYIVGNFSLKCIVDPSNTDIDLTDNITPIPSSETNTIISYNDKLDDVQLLQKTFIKVGKCIDKNNSLEATVPTSQGTKNNIENLFNLSNNANCNITLAASTNNIQPEFSTTLSGLASPLLPFNKFTKYYIAINTNCAGINIDASNVAHLNNPDVQPDPSANNLVTFSFTDENNIIVNDLEIDTGIGANPTSSADNIIVPISTGTNKDDNNRNIYTDASGNTWLFVYFTRLNNRSNYGESSYSKLNISYSITNASGTPSNFKQLIGPYPLATVDYSNVGLVSVNMSQVFLGNWRIMPSGDGQSLLFRYVTDGINPYTVSMSMDETQTSFSSTANVNYIVPHLSVPNKIDSNNYPGSSR